MLAISLNSSHLQFTVLSGPLGVVELIPLPNYPRRWVEGQGEYAQAYFSPTPKGTHKLLHHVSGLLTSAVIQPDPKTQLDPVAQGLRRGPG